MQGAEPEQNVVVVANVLSRNDDNRDYVNVGDVFLTPREFVYVPYSSFRSSAPTSGAAAAALGGVAGLLSNSLLDGSVTDAHAGVSRARIRDWGLPLAERITKHPGSKRIARNEISDAAAKDGVALVVGRETLLFQPAPEGADQGLRDALAGQFGIAPPPRAKLDELFLAWQREQPLPADAPRMPPPVGADERPAALLEQLLARGPAALSATFDAISHDPAHLTHTLAAYQLLSASKRRQLLEHFRALPQPFKAGVVQMLERRGRGAEKKPKLAFALLFVALLAILVTTLQILTSPLPATGGHFIVYMIAGFVVFFAGLLISVWHDRKKATQQLSAFRGTSS